MTRGRRYALLGALALGVLVLGLSVHSSQRATFRVHYRGTPERTAKDLTLHQTLRATRCIPWLTCTWSYGSGWVRAVAQATQRVPASPEGATFEVSRARALSLGRYEVESLRLVADPDDTGAETPVSPWGADRWVEDGKGGLQAELSILDLTAVPPSFRLPLPLGAPTVDVTIDFDPLVYTVFEGLPYRERWTVDGSRCSTGVPALELIPGTPKTLRYRVTALPAPRAGRPAPPARQEAEAFLVNGSELTDLLSERADRISWERLRRRAVQPPDLQLTHEPAKATLRLEARGPLRDKVALVAGTPSTDGRYFGFDCTLLEVKASAP